MFQKQFHHLVPQRFSTKEQIFFAKRLSFLLKADVPLATSLEIIRDQARQERLRAVYAALLAGVENGQPLGVAMRRQGKSFADFSIAMVRIGETSATLGASLAFLAEELAKKQALWRKIASSLAYPAIIAFSTLGVTTFLVVYIFPKVTPIFITLGVQLPLSTRILMAAADFLSRYGVLVFFGLVLAVVAAFLARKKYATVKYKSDFVLLKLPLLGTLIRSYNLANFCRTLGLLLESAMPIVSAIAMAGEASHNARYKAALAQASAGALRGEMLSRCLKTRPDLFSDMTVQLIAIGEQTGTLPDTLKYLSQLNEDDVDLRTKNLSSAVEPLLMLTMGLTIGFVAISIITPLYGITAHLTPR